MTRQKLAIIAAGALAILYGYMILSAFAGGGEIDPLHFISSG